ncbi:3-hydroxybutyryl-CoA dehydrogenase [Leminorella grimontii]|uniref:3-hydroxybutyryl-CoA dehydrogenase n=1 Tax=Leminorella grimontii TaxID=82981 RepID=A0AAV5N0F4_9GAMM|nr:3-hydroxyacyl-CoA dehydrogenase NAD-binding domain-containing protein [Leminorella grimontii]KFC97520.1 3-hydroxybutyryl-CoA dehydrogenase [Leminorella grimontii ATCC 33999 = DSM 5078]GKX55119.1 3-hydroxybutyryl-CoA dehydrogenase [Leminorella grimontii]VFS56878.1 3-hydroxybutyryl-CoA dehydrogenase [Leminorella grimontii]
MKVGVIGAGAMGAGIAQVFAAAEGFSVVLCDIKQEFAEKGKNGIIAALGRLVEKGKMEPEKAKAIAANITPGLTDAVADCDLIIEAVVEKIEIKRQLFNSLMKTCRPDAIFASNTSSLSITELSAGLDRQVIGLHFFNPAPVMALVEIVVGLGTTDETVAKMQELVTKVGKVAVISKDAPGFIVNRVLIPMVNEAIGIYADGTASAEDIDTAMKLGANHPMGPLALGDLIGLDVCLAIMEVLYSETGDPKYRPHVLLRKMVRGGALGKKSGKGFYRYG